MVLARLCLTSVIILLKVLEHKIEDWPAVLRKAPPHQHLTHQFHEFPVPPKNIRGVLSEREEAKDAHQPLLEDIYSFEDDNFIQEL